MASERPGSENRQPAAASTADEEPSVASGDEEPSVASGDEEPSVASGDEEPSVDSGDDEPSVASGDDDRSRIPPSDAFQSLANETRTAVLRTLAASGPQTFSQLHGATDEDSSAGFAYHLRQLIDRFVNQRDDERYELSSAGREIVRSVRAGTYTDSVDRDPIALEDDCPHCHERDLRAQVTDNVTEIDCAACGRPILSMSVPPSGYATRSSEALPDALDAYQRRRIEGFADGVCPDCGGYVTAGMESALPDDATLDCGGRDDGPLDRGGRDDGPLDHGHRDDETRPGPEPVQIAFTCDGCGSDLRCPVSLAVLDHPAVVAFYRDHDRDVRDRPIWNVGTEWRERVISQDPWCVRVHARLDDESLLLYVARDGTVVDTDRVTPDDDERDDDKQVDRSTVSDESPATSPDEDKSTASDLSSSDSATA